MKELALALVLTFIAGCATTAELARTDDVSKHGPSYVLPHSPKPQILRFTCYWAEHQLTCGPALGTKEWIDD